MLNLQDRAPGCVSDLILDQIRAGEPVSHHARDHVDACAPCRDRLALLDGDAAPFREGALPPWLAPRPRRSWVRPLVATSSLLAAVILLWLMRIPPSAERTDDTLRIKGRGALTIYVRQDGRTFLAEPGARVHPGDAVRIALSAPKPSWVAVFGRDATGTWSTYHPLGTHAEPVAAGAEQLLDTALELDDVIGEETFLAVFCAAPVELDAIRGTVMETFPNLDLPDGCHASSVTLEKVR